MEDRELKLWEVLERLSHEENRNEIWETTSIGYCLKTIETNCFGNIKFYYKYNDDDYIPKEEFEEKCTVITLANPYQRFRLKVTPIDFQEAYKSYQEGKTIKSLVSENYYKKEDGNHLYKALRGWCINDEFSMDEIDGQWIIVK